MNELVVLFAAGAGMWAMRASAILLSRGHELPDGLTRELGYAKHAVLAALVGSAVTVHDGGVLPSIASAPLIAAFAAMLVAWRFRNILVTVLVGMLATTIAVAAGL